MIYHSPLEAVIGFSAVGETLSKALSEKKKIVAKHLLSLPLSENKFQGSAEYSLVKTLNRQQISELSFALAGVSISDYMLLHDLGMVAMIENAKVDVVLEFEDVGIDVSSFKEEGDLLIPLELEKLDFILWLANDEALYLDLDDPNNAKLYYSSSSDYMKVHKEELIETFREVYNRI